MVKNGAAPPKWLFYIVTWIEKDQYTLIEQSVHWVLLTVGIDYQSIAIAGNDICIYTV